MLTGMGRTIRICQMELGHVINIQFCDLLLKFPKVAR